MKRRVLYLLAFACLVLVDGCAYGRGGRHGVIDTLYETFVVSRRSAEKQADYELDQFHNRD
jgi:hypothetical protein